MSLSQRATCHILSGHKESTSLFEAAKGVGQKGGYRMSELEKCGCRRSGAEKRWPQKGDKGREKVAAAEMVEKVNPERKAEKRKERRKKVL